MPQIDWQHHPTAQPDMVATVHYHLTRPCSPSLPSSPGGRPRHTVASLYITQADCVTVAFNGWLTSQLAVSALTGCIQWLAITADIPFFWTIQATLH